MPTVQAARPVIYHEVSVTVCLGQEALTAENARELLGWITPEEGSKFSSEDVHFKDRNGHQVHCSNITAYQRRYYIQSVRDLMWEILGGHWQFNGDSLTIGMTGYVLDGKHRLTALVLAEQEWLRNPERYPFWKSQPTIDVIIVTGIQESSKVANTIGIGRERSLADSIFSSGVFTDVSRKEADKMSKVIDNAVRMLWERTGAIEDAYNPRISHSMALDFVSRHETLLQCVKTVCSEDGKERKLSSKLNLGFWAALMYLMSTWKCEPNDYRNNSDPTEALLGDLDVDKADQFIALVAHKDKVVSPLLEALRPNDEGIMPAKSARICLIIQAWWAWASNGKILKKDMELEYETHEGVRTLVSNPITGGIDNGFYEES